MKKTLEELRELSKVYFNNKETNLIYATEDGNFFFENSHNHALNHAKLNKQQIFTIYRAELLKESAELNEKPAELIKESAELLKESAELEVKKEIKKIEPKKTETKKEEKKAPKKISKMKKAQKNADAYIKYKKNTL